MKDAKRDLLSLAAVQLNSEELDKKTNIERMDDFILKAAGKGADLISFPEICITGYNIILYTKSKKTLLSMAESVPGGASFRHFSRLAKEKDIAVLYGLLEKDGDKLYNTYVCIRPDSTFSKYRKIHAFENTHVLQGSEFVTFDLFGWNCGTLICYDNNLPENARIYMLRGCELMFSPHQTGGFDIEVAGMGRIDVKLWKDRKKNPRHLFKEFMGPKGREWIQKWLPSRSYDNGFYTVFTNGVGLDHDELRTGNAMVIDPNGVVISESRSIDSDVIYAKVSKNALKGNLGQFHNKTRRPELYGEISKRRKGLSDTRNARNDMTKNSKIA